MNMLCACSGEQFPFEDAPRSPSPESLATRDFCVSRLSSKEPDGDSKFDENDIDNVELTLKETLSLNYEEARALLGRLEYQKGNFDAALRVFQGIDICGLRPKIIKAISERTRPRKVPTSGTNVLSNTMSMHSVSLLLEAILLKSKSYEGLGRIKDAAMECTTILDIIESSLPHGICSDDDSRMKETFHKALELLPELWKHAGFLEEAIQAYRRAIVKPWDLEPKRLACIQKDLATLLLYGGVESSIPPQSRLQGSTGPTSNIEEAILLLLILMAKVEFQEIRWDPEIMHHLTVALSLSGNYDLLADHIERLLPGVYSRGERWYFLLLCYSAAGMDDVVLNLLSKVMSPAGKNSVFHLQSLLLGAKLCCKGSKYACEGTKFATRAISLANNGDKHFVGVASHLLGVCSGHCARSSVFDLQRLSSQSEALKVLKNVQSHEGDSSEVLYNLAVEKAMQRDINAAMENAAEYLTAVAGSSASAWKLFALLLSAEQNLKGAEKICNIAIQETEVDDQLEFLRMKALLQFAQELPKQSIETYKVVFTTIQTQKERNMWIPGIKTISHQKLEAESWLDLADIYSKLASWDDSNICLGKARSVEYFSSRSWHATGLVWNAQSFHSEALAAFLLALSIEPDHVPSMISMAVALRTSGGASLPVSRSLLLNALRLDPRNHEAWLNLGIVSKMEGNLIHAADCFEAAHDLQQSSPILEFS